MRERLRARTAAAHHALETSLDLLGGAAGPQRMRTLLARFHGFHAVWEPTLARSLQAPADFIAARARLPALRADLATLGVTDDEIAALPRCEAAAALASSPAGALGSLYVLEGSTLGGQLIGRALATHAWWPPGGLRYFDPHGRETGVRWRETLALLESTPAAEHGALIAAAQATFGLLQGWLPSYSERCAAAA